MKQGGFNFDAKIRRQSIDVEDLFYAHIGGMDTCAKTLIVLEKLINDGQIPNNILERYKKWDEELGKTIYKKDTGLDTLHKLVIDKNLNPKAKSGQQEMLENLLNKYLL